jgi:hypothetical protein
MFARSESPAPLGRAPGEVLPMVVRVAAGLVSGIILTSPAYAGLEGSKTSGTSTHAVQSSRPDGADPRIGQLDPAVQSARKAERRLPSLRCWQEGKLVFDGPGLLPAARPTASVEFRSVGAPGPAVQVLDFKSGLCFLDLREAP